MKKSLLIILFCLCGLPVTAQHTITGSVVRNADGEKIPYATVALLKADSVIVTGSVTNAEGNFTMESVQSGSYIILVTYVGYQEISRNVTIPAQYQLGEFRLNETENRITDVVVVGRRPFVEQQTDRYVVNVGNNILTAGRNAVDVLANTPGVMVSDGSISVMGKEVEVYVDGRPSRLSGEQLIALLSSIQGDNVARVEIITNPSSRYDAVGIGGIIDIRTKKGLQYGFNASLDAGFRQGRRDTENAGITLNYGRKNFNLFGNYSISRTNSWAELNQINSTQANGVSHLFDQNTVKESSAARVNQSYRVGMDYYLNEKNILGFLYNGYRAGNELSVTDGTTTLSPALEGVVSSAIHSESTNDNHGDQLNLNYQSTFDKPGQRLNIDLDYGKFVSGPWQMSEVDYFDIEGLPLEDRSERLRHANPQQIEVWAAKVDYAQPLWENARMEFGGKTGRSITDNNLLFEEYGVDAWEIDPDRTNRFVYREAVHSGYLTFNQGFGKVNLQAGLRGEYTDSEGEQRTTGEINRRYYFDLFPTLYLNYRLSDKHQFGVSYGRRIMRPNYGQLNPFEVKLDAYSFEAGNPDLKPSYIDNVSFSYTLGQSIMLRLSYDHTKDMISIMPVQQQGRYGMVRANFGERESVTAMVNYRVSPAKFWNINMAVIGLYSHNKSRESYGEIDNESVATQAQIANNFRISQTLSAELTGLYQSKIQDAYMELEPMGNVSLGVRKTFFDNKFSVSIAANDLFYTSKQNIASVNGLEYRMNIRRDTRYVNFSVRYNFGSGNARAARNRTSGIEDEKRRAQ
ncbi:MAG: TonB-dependent receptor family protein [Alistipes sp.]|jgi:outer membrane receptor protein involved in Fe transport|nr:TonB-dependent receptor family protein [Alistipes sp.]